MNIGSSPSQGLIGSIDVTRTSLEMQQTLSTPDGAAARALLVDAVEVNIQIDGEFANRVLQDSTEDKLNAAFATAGMDTTVDSLLQSGMDFSPGATAKRIVDFSLSFFGAFQQNNADLDGAAEISGFAELIKGAIEEGFASAKDLLAGLGEISPAVQAEIDETFDLTMQGIDSFVEEQMAALSAQGEEEDPVGVI